MYLKLITKFAKEILTSRSLAVTVGAVGITNSAWTDAISVLTQAEMLTVSGGVYTLFRVVLAWYAAKAKL